MPVKNYPIDHLVLLYTCKLVLTSQKLIHMAHNYVVYVGLPFGILSLIHMNCTSYYSHSQHAILHISNVNPFILILHISDTHTHYYVCPKGQKPIITHTVGWCCKVKYTFLGLGETKTEQELQCSNQLKKESDCSHMTNSARNGNHSIMNVKV